MERQKHHNYTNAKVAPKKNGTREQQLQRPRHGCHKGACLCSYKVSEPRNFVDREPISFGACVERLQWPVVGRSHRQCDVMQIVAARHQGLCSQQATAGRSCQPFLQP